MGKGCAVVVVNGGEVVVTCLGGILALQWIIVVVVVVMVLEVEDEHEEVPTQINLKSKGEGERERERKRDGKENEKRACVWSFFFCDE